MSRISAAIGSAVFFVIAPVLISGLVPWWMSGWRMQEPFFGLAPLRALGALLVAIGIPVVLEAFGRFVLEGHGTPAPVLPTRHLVVGGTYRHVRNPIYLAVVSIILGQGLILGNVALLVYGAVLWLFFHVWVLAIEEPTLRGTFAAEYATYCANVPRWVPRLAPWKGSAG